MTDADILPTPPTAVDVGPRIRALLKALADAVHDLADALAAAAEPLAAIGRLLREALEARAAHIASRWTPAEQTAYAASLARSKAATALWWRSLNRVPPEWYPSAEDRADARVAARRARPRGSGRG